MKRVVWVVEEKYQGEWGVLGFYSYKALAVNDIKQLEDYYGRNYRLVKYVPEVKK